LDASLTTLLCKQITVAESKEVKTGCKSGRIFQGRLWLKQGCFACDDRDDE
jgi:hypothetical protein